MGLGGTARKLQKVTEMAEDVYARMNELRDQVVEMREATRETSDRVDRLEAEAAEMRAILRALAEEEGIDVDSVIADAHISEAERSADGSAAAGESSAAAGDSATATSESAQSDESAGTSESTTPDGDAEDASTGA